MGVLEKHIEELDRLEAEYKRERKRIEQAISVAVGSIGQNPAITPLGENTFTIQSSELIDAPWSPEFHDWTKQAEKLLAILSKKPARQWVSFINELLEKNARNGWPGVTVDKTLLSKKFLHQVIAKL